MKKVFITGGDQAGWAMDQEIAQLKAFYQLPKDCRLTDSAADCDFIHSVWWESLYRLPLEILKNKFILCSISNRPFHYLTNPKFTLILPYLNIIISQTRQAQNEFKKMGIDSFYLPYTVDLQTFNPQNSLSQSEIRRKYNLPQDKYLIGNFHRDSEGSDLSRPKLQKGPDLFLEIVKELWRRHQNIHILLAGPRRHWLRSHLQRLSIPYTFIGELVAKDDWQINILKPHVINELYHALDLAIVTSRWEGAPRTILEAAATKTKIISTPVGIANDLLDPNCLYTDPLRAVRLIEADLEHNTLARHLEQHYTKLINNHTVKAQHHNFLKLYSTALASLQAKKRKSGRNDPLIRALTRSPAGLNIGVWHQFKQPPYGGGNQFMLALCKFLRRRMVKIFENKIEPGIDCYIINSVHFEIEQFLKKRHKNTIPIVHRIDGPIKIYRGIDQGLDDLCHKLNHQLAVMTILQSNYVLTANVKLGYRYVNPVIIRNAVDQEIFNRTNRKPFSRQGKIKIISTSWSKNLNKGFEIYRWLDANLDWERYSYTFVGNSPVTFNNIKVINAVGSEKLAEILKQHDIYITASKNDPCSNALIEALACGLPAIFLDSGGHGEIVGWGGLGFKDRSEIPGLLETMVDHYEMFQNLISVESIDQVAEKYYQVLKIVALAVKKK